MKRNKTEARQLEDFWDQIPRPVREEKKEITENKEKYGLSVPFIPNIPISWIRGALLSPGKTSVVKMALFVWYKKGLRRSKTDLVISSSQAQDQFGVTKWDLSRFLKELESLKMIEIINQGHGRSPRVTVLQKERGKRSLKVPFISSIPISWIRGALLSPGKNNAVKLALFVWYKKGLQYPEKEFIISSTEALEEFGISSSSFTRALKELESLSMIKIIDQGRGKSPKVTVLWEGEEEESGKI